LSEIRFAHLVLLILKLSEQSFEVIVYHLVKHIKFFIVPLILQLHFHHHVIQS
jgi:hypothetical protein